MIWVGIGLIAVAVACSLWALTDLIEVLAFLLNRKK